jgi:hypothetical protein
MKIANEREKQSQNGHGFPIKSSIHRTRRIRNALIIFFILNNPLTLSSFQGFSFIDRINSRKIEFNKIIVIGLLIVINKYIR